MAEDKVSVVFGAQTAELNAGVDEVKTNISELGDSAGDITSKFKEIGEALVAVFAVDKLTEFIGKMAELGEQIERTAKMTGLSTDEVQAFQYAVKMAGGDADTAGQSLLRFENNLAKAQEGTGPAATAYKALGISLVDMAGNAKPLNEVLAEVADKFSQAADGARKVEYATALGSRGFAQLIPVLDKGRDGLDTLNKKLEELHGKQSPETVEALSNISKAGKDLDAAWEGLSGDVVATFASPKLKEGMASFIGQLHEAFDWVKQLDQAWKDWTQNGSLAQFLGEGNYRQAGSGASGSWGPAAVLGTEQYGPSQLKPSLPALSTGTPSGPDTTGDDTFLDMVRQNLKLLETQEEENKKITAEYTKDWNTAFNVVDRSLDSMLQGVLMGTQTWQQAMGRLFDNLALSAIEAIAKIMLKAGALQAMELISPGSAATSALSKMVPSFLGGSEGATQDASMTALTAALTANTAALTGQTVATTAGAVSTDTNTATQSTGIGAWIANTVATVSNTVATEASDIGKLLSFDVGTSSLPFSGPIMAHKGEMILPPDISAQVRSGQATIGTASGLGGFAGGGDNYNVNFSIQALDSQSVAAMLKGQGAVISQIVATQLRNQSSQLSKSFHN